MTVSVSVVGVVVDGLIVFETYTSSQKVVNLERDPRITVLLEDGLEYNNLRGVMIKGTANLVSEPTEVKQIAREVIKRNQPEIPDEMLDELPNRSIKRTTNYLGTGLDVFCSKKAYIIIDGEHEDGEGRYYSPGGLDVCDLQHPPKEVWDLVLEIAELQRHDKSSSKTYSNTKSKKLYPCPICGRDKNHWCFENDNGLIHCMNGQTFSAEKEHGPLKLGDVVNGYVDGIYPNRINVHQSGASDYVTCYYTNSNRVASLNHMQPISVSGTLTLQRGMFGVRDMEIRNCAIS